MPFLLATKRSQVRSLLPAWLIAFFLPPGRRGPREEEPYREAGWAEEEKKGGRAKLDLAQGEGDKV